MARKDRTAASKGAAKEPGRIKQMWQVFQMTRRYDSQATLWIVGVFLLPVALGVVLGILLNNGNALTGVLYVVAGVMLGLLLAMVVLGRRAERAAYSQIEGQPGAVGAVLRSSLRRGWTGSEMPVAVNGKTHDAVYRAVGRGGVVLIGEGPKTRLTRMLDEERRRVVRVVGTVPVTMLSVGPDADAVPLHKVSRSLARIKPALTKAEVMAVASRVNSLKSPPPIPKGIDPQRARPQRGR